MRIQKSPTPHSSSKSAEIVEKIIYSPGRVWQSATEFSEPRINDEFCKKCSQQFFGWFWLWKLQSSRRRSPCSRLQTFPYLLSSGIVIAENALVVERMKRYLIENTHTWKFIIVSLPKMEILMWWRNIRISIKQRNEIYTCNSSRSFQRGEGKLLCSLGFAHDFMLLLSFRILSRRKNFVLLVANKFQALSTRAHKLFQQLGLFNLTPKRAKMEHHVRRFKLPLCDSTSFRWVTRFRFTRI